MGLIMQKRHAVVRDLSSRFQISSRKDRRQNVTDFVRLSGFNRYAASILSDLMLPKRNLPSMYITRYGRKHRVTIISGGSHVPYRDRRA